MGLEDLIDDEAPETSSRHRKYEKHEREDELEEWAEELKQRFPTEIPIEFIEVSTRMKKNAASVYTKRKEGELIHYIRVSEGFIEESEDAMIRHVLLHCMVSIYFKELGLEGVTTNSSIFKWVCGRVGCKINAVDTESEEWVEAAVPFLEEDMVTEDMLF